MSQENVYDGIYTKLTANQVGGSFYDTIANSNETNGKAIWFIQAPQDEAMPLCIITPVSDVPVKYFGDSDLDMEFQTDLYLDADDSTPDAAVQLLDLLLAELYPSGVPATLTITNHSQSQITCLDRGVPIREEDAYRVTSQWRVYATSD